MEFVESRQGAGEVLKVRLLIGELAGVEAEQLLFCYNSITHAGGGSGSLSQLSLSGSAKIPEWHVGASTSCYPAMSAVQ